MGVIGELVVRLGLDSKGLTSGLAVAEAETKRFGSSGLGGLTGNLGRAEKAALTEAGAVEKGGVKAAEAAAKHANLGSALGGVASIAGLAPMGAGIGQLNTLEGSAVAAGGGLSGMALIAGGVAVAGVAAVGLKAAEAAKRFDDSMTVIQTQAGASAAEVDKMKQGILDMAGQVGAGPEALSAGLYHIESAGFSGAKALDILKTSAEGAAVGHADLESVTNALVAAMNSGVGGITDSSQAMGVLNSVIGAGNMRMEDLTAALGTGVLSSAKTFGVNIQSVGGALAAMTNQGVPAIDAATRLQSAMRLMAAPTKAAEKDLARVGLSGTALASDLRSPGGILTAVQDLKSHMEKAGLSATQQAALMANAFGGKQSGAILTLVGGIDKLKSAQDRVNAGTGGFAAAWATTQKDVDQEQKQLQSSLAATEVKLGNLFLPLEEAALPVLNTIVGAIGAVVGALSDWVTANGPLLSSIGNVLSAALSPFSAALDLITKNMDVFGPIIAGVIVVALGALAMALAPVVIAMGALAVSTLITLAPFIAIAAAIGAVIYVITHWTQVLSALGPAVAGVAGAIGGFISSIGAALGMIPGLIKDFLTEPFGVFLDDLNEMGLGTLATLWGAFGDTLGKIGALITGLPGAVASWVGGLVGQALQVAARLPELLGAAIGQIVGFFLSLPLRIVAWEIGIVSQALALVPQVIGIIAGLVGQVVGFILSIPGRIVGFITGSAGVARNAAASFLPAIVGLAGNVVSAIIGIPGRFLSALVSGFADAAASAVKAFMGAITGLPGKVAGIIGNIGGSIAGAAGNFIGGLIPHAEGAWNIPSVQAALLHPGEMVLPATVAQRVRSGMTAGGTGQSQTNVYNLTVNNPQPEPASTSIRREVDKMQRMSAFGY